LGHPPLSFRAVDPSNGLPLETEYVSGTAEDVDRACNRAAAAFRDYSRRSGAERARLLRRMAEGIEDLGDSLIDCVMQETALPRARIAGERARTCMQLRLFASVAEEGSWVDERIDAADPSRQPPRPRVRSLLRPIGPVAVFGASNFPLAFSVAGGDTAAALAVGCTVVVKAHPAHPGTSVLVASAIEEALKDCALPAGVFSLLLDEGHAVGLSLVEHPLIRAGAFTGSHRGGLALTRAAQARPQPIPFFAEMGSVNPVFLFPDALAARGEAIAAGLHNSLTLGVGQFCTQPGVVFVVRGEATDAVLQRMAALVVATPRGTMLTKQMRIAYQQARLARGAQPGVSELAQAAGDPPQVPATLFTVDVETFLATRELVEEIFGPTSLVVLCESVRDFERCARYLPGQLTATVHAQSAERAEAAELLWELEQKAGRLVYDGFPTGVEVGTAMVHGGPFPATSDSRFTSVGTRSLYRFVRPVAYQGEEC
jgi:2,5-dioxopentanoate dehydrogenase